MISRRKLFGFAAAAAGSLLLPELASSTSIFLPPAGGWPRRYDPAFRPQYFNIVRADGPGMGIGHEPKPLLVGGLNEWREDSHMGNHFHNVKHTIAEPFYGSPEHTRRKKRLDCIDGQMVWVPV
jgi:hypothetical protein